MNVDELAEQVEAARLRAAALCRSDGDMAPEERAALLADAFKDLEATVADLQAAEKARQFLGEASTLLASSLDYETTLASVAQLAVPHFADYCIVDMLQDDQSLRQVAVAHVDPAKVELVRELRRRSPFDPNLPYGVAKVLRTGQSELVSEIPDSVLANAGRDTEQVRIIRELNPRSYIIVPLVARGRSLGALSFVAAESGRRFSAADLALAEDLGRRAALAVDNARLYAEAREAVQHKDEALALLDTLFASAPVGLGFWDRELRYVRINEALAAINGLPSEAHLGRTLSEVLPGLDEQVVQDYRRVLETGEPIVDQEASGETPAAPGKRRYWLASYYPVRGADGQPLGVGGVVTEITERKQAEADLQARARQQAVVAELGLLALTADDLDTLMDQAVNLVAQTLEVEYCKVLELLPDGRALLLRAGVGWKEGLVGQRTVGAGVDSQAGYTLLSREPVIVEDLRTETRFNGPSLLHDHGVVSGMSVIIQGQPRPFGVLGAHTARRRTFTEDDTNFLQAVANVLAAAIGRKHTEDELRRSRDQLAIILRGVADGITVQDTTGELIYANEAAARIIGYPSVQALQESPVNEVMQRFEVMDELGQPLPLSQLPGRRALQEGQEVERLLRFRVVASGQERWSIVRATPVLDEWRQVRMAINIFHDVTESRRIEENLRFLAEASTLLASSLDYETTLQSVARLVVPFLADWCVVSIVAADGSVRQVAAAHVNPAKVEWAAELQRRYPTDMNASSGLANVLRTGQPEFYPEIAEAMLAATARDPEHLHMMREVGFTSAMIVPLLARGQTLGALSFVSAESGRHFGAADLQLAEDLARRAAVSVDNARLYREAREAIGMRDEFLSIAAHELKTPVTSLLGYTQVLQRRFAREKTASDRDQRALKVISEQSERLSRLIHSLLDLSRIQTGHFTIQSQPVDLCVLARRVVDEARPALERHTLELSCAGDSFIVEGDELRLEQVLQNLLQNAIKYSPDGGLITVGVEQRGNQASLAISDQGIGIPEAAQAQLFQRFYRAANTDGSPIGGMGIGLYVVKEIVTRHGGTVEVTSVEGKGSTFTVRLPLASGQETKDESSSSVSH